MILAPRRSRSFLRSSLILFLGGALAAAACDSNPEVKGSGDGDGDSGDGDSGDGDSGDGDNGDGDGDINIGGQGGGTGDGDGDGDGPVCETSSSEAELAPIFLAFAYDVSGSMGHYDCPNWWHDPDAKWTPVREATQAFFEDESSVGISASMAFFPGASDLCEAATYETPDVEMTMLPSNLFAGAFDGYEAEVGSPLPGGDWRGNTPTLAAFTGTSTYLDQFVLSEPDAKFAVVLVTDGLPQGCSGDGNTVPALTTAVENLYDAGNGVRTYVIGIENPTTPPAEAPTYDGWDGWSCNGASEPATPPDTLGALNGVAAAGGTTEAFLIDTGDPEATKANFRAAIDVIRTEAISCELGIPPHPRGGTFDADKIDVSYTLDGETNRFDYDPGCEVEGAWHYDDEEDPTMIELCLETCEFIQSSPGAELNVDFLCEDRPDVVK